MALVSGQFQAIANKLITKTFNAFSKTLTIKTPDAPVFGSPQTYTNETGLGIELSIDQGRFDGSLVQQGDFLIFTNASDWSAAPTVGAEIAFDGVYYQVINIEKDADNAAYFLQVRTK